MGVFSEGLLAQKRLQHWNLGCGVGSYNKTWNFNDGRAECGLRLHHVAASNDSGHSSFVCMIWLHIEYIRCRELFKWEFVLNSFFSVEWGIKVGLTKVSEMVFEDCNPIYSLSCVYYFNDSYETWLLWNYLINWNSNAWCILILSSYWPVLTFMSPWTSLHLCKYAWRTI